MDPGRVGCPQAAALILSAYFDESGHDNRLLVLGGLVSGPERWALFADECERIKSYFRIPYIHAAELFNIKKTKRYGHLSEQERMQVLGVLLSAIHSHAEFSICSAVIPAEYEALTTPKWRARNGTAYSLCVNGILLGLWEKLAGLTSEEVTVSIFFEEGHAHTGEALETVRGYGASVQHVDHPVIGPRPPRIGLQIGATGTGTKDQMPPLWAADLVSYCTYNQIIRKDEFCREIMDAFEQKVPACGVMWDDEKIRFMVDASREADDERRQWENEAHSLVREVYQFGIVAKKHPRGVILDSSQMTPDQRARFFGDEPGEEQP